MNRWRRLGLALLFVTSALGLGVVGEATYGDRWPYPTEEEIAGDYERYVGEQTLLFGSVQGVTETGATVRTGEGPDEVMLTVRNFEATAQPGGVVQVLGVLEPDEQLRAERVVVVNASSDAQLGKYATSLAGLLVFLGLFAREWRVNVSELTLEEREDG